MPKVSVAMQVYNTEAYLPQCMESVLNQTFSDFEFLIVDNGSTDGCRELLERYAAQDSRIRLTRYEQNRRKPFWLSLVKERGSGSYITNIDSDDWWEADYLEQLVNLAEKYKLDVACTGSISHTMPEDTTVVGWKLPRRLIMERRDFGELYSYYHAFFGTTWGKLYRMDLFQKADCQKFLEAEPSYGMDTLIAFEILQQASRVGIDPSAMYHYRLHRRSVSYEYDPHRFEANVFFYNNAVEFLSAYGPVSRRNRHFLHIAYACLISATQDLIWGSALSREEKLAEYCKIAVHPITRETFLDAGDHYIDSSREKLRQYLVAVSSPGDGKLAEAIQAVSCVPTGGEKLSSLLVRVEDKLWREIWLRLRYGQ